MLIRRGELRVQLTDDFEGLRGRLLSTERHKGDVCSSRDNVGLSAAYLSSLRPLTPLLLIVVRSYVAQVHMRTGFELLMQLILTDFLVEVVWTGHASLLYHCRIKHVAL